ncbi:hypothetical protein BDR03DRAFT_955686, partial [Suillus americanus]
MRFSLLAVVVALTTSFVSACLTNNQLIKLVKQITIAAWVVFVPMILRALEWRRFDLPGGV